MTHDRDMIVATLAELRAALRDVAASDDDTPSPEAARILTRLVFALNDLGVLASASAAVAALALAEAEALAETRPAGEA